MTSQICYFNTYLEVIKWGVTTPNAAPIEIHVNCLNSMGRFFDNIHIIIVSHIMTKPDLSIFKKQVRYKYGSQTDFEPQSMTCINVRTAEN